MKMEGRFAKQHKRKSSSSTDNESKFRKVIGLIQLIQNFEVSKASKQKFEELFNSDIEEKAGNCSASRYAIRRKRKGWVEFLLDRGADPTLVKIENYDGEALIAAEFAWKNDDYDTVVQLLRAGSPYPRYFNADRLTEHHKVVVETLNQRTTKLHEAIRADSFNDVTEYTKKYSKTEISYAYNVNNKCALTTALECKNFKMYAYLRSRRFSCGIDNEHEDLLEKLQRHEKELLDLEIEKYFGKANFHILDLLSKSRLGINNDKKCHIKLNKYFEKLDEIEEIHPILKFNASDKALSLTFDFNESDIDNLDPSRCFKSNENKVRGRTFKKTSKIYIAAKQENEKKVLGILSQELAHFAILKVYNNECLPFRKDDVARKNEFREIAEECRNSRAEEEVIDTAFKYETENGIMVELIARVPQLIAQNDSDKLCKNRTTFKKLFDFYDNIVLRDIKKEVFSIMPKQEVQELNKTLGVLHRLKTTIKSCKFLAKIPKEAITEKKNVLVETKLPDLVLLNLIETFKLNDCDNVFIEFEQLKLTENLNLIANIVKCNWHPKIFVLDSNKNIHSRSDGSISGQMEDINECKIILISRKKEDVPLEKFQLRVGINLNYRDLIDKSERKEVLNFFVYFQRSKLKLLSLLEVVTNCNSKNEVEEIFSWPLEDFFFDSKVDLNNYKKHFPKQAEILMPRLFQQTGQSETLNETDVVLKLQKVRTIIISDVAGMGKTMSAIALANEIKTSKLLTWIVFFDLKQHTDMFESLKKTQTIDLLTVLLLLKFERNIEKKLFKLFFENKKATFIFDGFDEIKPMYEDFVLKLIFHIQTSGNCILVTTRNHLESEIADKLGSNGGVLLNILPFTEEEQIKYLQEFWMLKSVRTEEFLANKARSMLREFQSSLVQKQDFLQIPLHLFMLADLSNSNMDFLNPSLELFSLCEKFVLNKLAIHDNYKGKLAAADNLNFKWKEFNVLLFHQKIAVESCYGRKIANSLQFPAIPDLLNRDVICRIGFLQIGSNGNFQFNHQTYRDFFVSQLLLKSIFVQSSSTQSNFLHDLLAKVMIGNTHFEENIRSFVNEKLTDTAKIFHLEKLLEYLEKYLLNESYYEFLISFVQRKHYNLISFILQKMELKKEVKLKIVTFKNSSKCNALHVATGSIMSWKLLWNCIENFTNDSEREAILQIRGGFNDFSILRMSKNFGKEIYADVYKIYVKVFGLNYSLFNSLIVSAENSNVFKESDKPLETLWKTVQAHVEPEQQTVLLFDTENSATSLFNDLMSKTVGVNVALSAIQRIFDPKELNNKLKTYWFSNQEKCRTLNSGTYDKILVFFQEHINDEGVKFKNLKNINIKEDTVEEREINETFLFKRILEKCGDLLFKPGTSEFRNFTVQALVLTASAHSQQIFEILWSFVELNFNENERKTLLLLDYETKNTLVAVTRNSHKSTVKYLFNILHNLFTNCSEDLQKAIKETDSNWIIKTLCRYANFAELEAFEMFWMFLRGNLNKFELKTIFLHQRRINVLMSSVGNKDISTIEFIIKIARNLCDPEDFAAADENNWIVATLGRFSSRAKPEVFQMFWSFLRDNLDEFQLMQVLLQKNQNGLNALAISANNKYISTIECIINSAKNSFVFKDIVSTLLYTDQKWPVDTLCRYAALAESKAFAIFWSLLKDNLSNDIQKLVLFSNNHKKLNCFSCSSQNKDIGTIEFIINTARGLFRPKEFSEALASKDKKWPAQALYHFAAIAELKAFKAYWSFVIENIDADDQKKDLTEIALISSAQNEHEQTVEFIINIVNSSIGSTGIQSALKLKNRNWLITTVCRYACLSKLRNFKMLWEFLEQNLNQDQKRHVFVEKEYETQLNAIMSLSTNKDIGTVSFVFRIVGDLFCPKNYAKPLLQDNRHWLIDATCHYTYSSENETFRIFWTFIEMCLKEEDRKLIFLQKNQRGYHALMRCAHNKDKLTVEQVTNMASNLLSSHDFAKDLQSEDESWNVESFCEYVKNANSDAFQIFQSFLQKNLDQHQIKLLFLKEYQRGWNAIKYIAFDIENTTNKKLVLKFLEKLALYDDIDNYEDDYVGYRHFLFFIFWFSHHQEEILRFEKLFENDYDTLLKKKYFKVHLVYFLTFTVNFDISCTLWEKTLTHLNPNEIRQQLLAKDKHGDNSFSNAAVNNNLIIIDFLTWFEKTFNKDLIVIFEERNLNLETVLHKIALHCNYSLCQKILSFFSFVNKTDIQAVLRKIDKSGEIPREVSTRNADANVSQLFHEFYTDHFSD